MHGAALAMANAALLIKGVFYSPFSKILLVYEKTLQTGHSYRRTLKQEALLSR